MCKIFPWIFLVIISSQFRNIRTDPQFNLLSKLEVSFVNSAKFFTKTVGNILNIQNPVTPTLCGLRTVRIDQKVKLFRFKLNIHFRMN